MTIFFDEHDFEIKEFYSYPTAVVHRIAEWDEGFRADADGLNKYVKYLFNVLLEVAEHKLNKHLMDNKVAMKIVHMPTNTEMYIGYKDWNWCVGLKLNPYMTGKMTELPTD